MNDNRAKKKGKVRRGRPPKHGGYSLLIKGKLPENRRYIARYLTQIREGLIEDLGPTEEDLSTGQGVLIDRIISKLGIIRCIEEHIRENSVIEGNNLAPSLKASYLAYNNSIRLDLQALGINSKKADEFPGPLEYAKEKYGKKEKENGEAKAN